MSAIKVERLSKNYGKVKALSDISFEVHEGEIFGLIGADGAGKTTLIRILTTLLLADSGNATVGGCDVVRDLEQIRKQVGYMPGRFSLYQDMSVEENLRFFASVFNTTIKENYDLIKDIYIQIEPFKKRLAGRLSGGMKQKLALSCALIHAPNVLFLDEPTTGVDAVSRREFWQMLKKLKEKGITILVSTPYMDEALQCDRIALIDKGHFLTIETPRGIIESYPEPIFAVKSRDMKRLLRDLRSCGSVKKAYAFGENHHFTLRDKFDIITYLRVQGHENVEIKEIEATIEDCFMKLVDNGE